MSQLKMSLRLLSLALATAASAAQQQGLPVTVLPADYAAAYGAACLDGSPPGFYSLVQDTSKWMIFIEGGGWCFDQTAAGTIQNCAGRAGGGGGSSNGMNPGTTFTPGGQLSSDPKINPNYYNWSLVFIHYCDGTSHSSNATDPVPVSEEIRQAIREQRKLHSKTGDLNAPGRDEVVNDDVPPQIYFRGRSNLRAVFQYLQEHGGMSNPTDVVLAGGSAGAISTYLAIDTVKGWLPSTTKLVGEFTHQRSRLGSTHVLSGACCTSARDDCVACSQCRRGHEGRRDVMRRDS